MIKAFQSIATYDFGTWLIGIVGAVISGGAMGLTAVVIGISWQKTLALVGVSAAISLGKFLQTHSTPDKLQAALDTAATESAKSVAQAGKAADAVRDARDAVQGP